MGSACEEDARRMLDVVRKRFGKYGLTLHPAPSPPSPRSLQSNLSFRRRRECRCLLITRHFKRFRWPGLMGHAVADVDSSKLAPFVESSLSPSAPNAKQTTCKPLSTYELSTLACRSEERSWAAEEFCFPLTKPVTLEALEDVLRAKAAVGQGA
jgi:hypothetical protein